MYLTFIQLENRVVEHKFAKYPSLEDVEALCSQDEILSYEVHY